jgi:hypothetical protein
MARREHTAGEVGSVISNGTFSALAGIAPPPTTGTVGTIVTVVSFSLAITLNDGSMPLSPKALATT